MAIVAINWNPRVSQIDNKTRSTWQNRTGWAAGGWDGKMSNKKNGRGRWGDPGLGRFEGVVRLLVAASRGWVGGQSHPPDRGAL